MMFQLNSLLQYNQCSFSEIWLLKTDSILGNYWHNTYHGISLSELSLLSCWYLGCSFQMPEADSPLPRSCNLDSYMKGKPWNLICASSCRLREEGSKFLILLSEGGSYLVIDLLAEGYVMFFSSKICTCSDMCKNSVLCFVSFISWTR